MINFFEVIKRALNGPYYTERDYDLKVMVPKLRELVKKYDIRYDPENPIPNDDKLADDVFQAALELAAATGCYCTDTSRVIHFTKEEILEGLRDAPAAPVFGEGFDRKTMLGREPEYIVRPTAGGPGGCCTGARCRAVTAAARSFWNTRSSGRWAASRRPWRPSS